MIINNTNRQLKKTNRWNQLSQISQKEARENIGSNLYHQK